MFITFRPVYWKNCCCLDLHCKKKYYRRVKWPKTEIAWRNLISCSLSLILNVIVKFNNSFSATVFFSYYLFEDALFFDFFMELFIWLPFLSIVFNILPCAQFTLTFVSVVQGIYEFSFSLYFDDFQFLYISCI